MDYTKSGSQELGTVIERHKWVEETEIRNLISELGWDLTPGAGILMTSIMIFLHSFHSM